MEKYYYIRLYTNNILTELSLFIFVLLAIFIAVYNYILISLNLCINLQSCFTIHLYFDKESIRFERPQVLEIFENVKYILFKSQWCFNTKKFFRQ